MIRSALLMLAAYLVCITASADTLNTALWVDGIVNGTADVSKNSFIEFEFRDAVTGDIAHHFHIMHAKPMHLIVVSEDLSQFAHVHPENRPHKAKAFHLTANSDSSDPDNFALSNLLPFGGRYFLFGEVMPMGYGMLNFPYDLNVMGPTRAAVAPKVDKPGDDGKILKYFAADDTPTDEANGEYLIKLEVLPMEHCQVIIPRLHFEVHVKRNGGYVPVKDLDQWLESYGHAILIGREGKVAAEKAILHLHAVWPLPTGDVTKDERGPRLELTTHSHGQSMQSDSYRAWIQLQHNQRVRTFNFEIAWDLERARVSAIPSSALCIQ